MNPLTVTTPPLTSDSLIHPPKRRRNGDDGSAEPNGKRRRIGGGNVTRRKRNILLKAAIIQELPLELIFEILYHLQPYDLLRLARTSHAFRGLLMHKTSAFLWRQARVNVEPTLPALPFDLTEPAYAHMLFHHYCTFCEKRCEKAMWECRVRCCKKCFKNKFIPDNTDTRNSCFNLLQNDRVLSAVPKATGDGFRPHLYIEVLDSLTSELLNLTTGSGADNGTIEEWISYRVSQYTTVKSHATECASWDSARKALLAQERADARNRRCEWIEERAITEGWDCEIKSLHSYSRFPLVITHAGNHPSINKKDKNALTDADWLRIKPTIILRLQSQRTELYRQAMRRRLLLLQDTYAKFLVASVSDVLNSQEPARRLWSIPSLGDLLTFSGPIRHLLESTPLSRDPVLTPIWGSNLKDFSIVNASNDTDFFNLIQSTLSSSEFAEFMEEWKNEKEKELLSIYSRATVASDCTGTDTEAQLSDLHLATTVFKCNALGCGKALYYDEALEHNCTTRYHFEQEASFTSRPSCPGIEPSQNQSLLNTDWSRSKPLPSFVYGSSNEGNSSPSSIVLHGISFDCCEILQVKPWNDGGNRISFNYRGSRLARRILERDRYFDSCKTTIEQIRACDPPLSCNTCFWSKFRWPGIFLHEDVKIHDPVIDWAEWSSSFAPSLIPQFEWDNSSPDWYSSQTPGTSTQAQDNSFSFSLEEWVFGSRCRLCNELLHPMAVSEHLRLLHDTRTVEGNSYLDTNSRLPRAPT
ncbi:hypothetical protein GYMLUDRAFT_49959 [Collybiopsis luxurians FD-317 M1]|uniref:F-box domain-containing protein n=1 Tax=Collybiopsis luxurians FD-317 M1 TaxID=944289 RepID=A0A0D0BCX5_9AGAR|nr:hypothetical protein GYMLUDRAFT_49959 [Collybiopsis luxurians FD-317 M1]